MGAAQRCVSPGVARHRDPGCAAHARVLRPDQPAPLARGGRWATGSGLPAGLSRYPAERPPTGAVGDRTITPRREAARYVGADRVGQMRNLGIDGSARHVGGNHGAQPRSGLDTMIAKDCPACTQDYPRAHACSPDRQDALVPSGDLAPVRSSASPQASRSASARAREVHIITWRRFSARFVGFAEPQLMICAVARAPGRPFRGAQTAKWPGRVGNPGR